MAIPAWILEVAFLVLAVGGRVWLQRRRTGTSGVTIRQPATSGAEKVVKLLLALTVVGLGVATALAAGDDAPGAALVGAGLLLAVGGIAGTFWAQLAMGDDWRIGMDHETETNLVTGGPYRSVRNPIYTSMFAFVAGIVLLIPSAFTIALLVLTVVALELQVRAVEEPFLTSRHDRAFASWAAEAGRFLPGIGRLRTD